MYDTTRSEVYGIQPSEPGACEENKGNKVKETQSPEVGLADPSELKEIEDLDRVCFPADDVMHEESIPGEISGGVLGKQMLVARSAHLGRSAVIAYLNFQPEYFKQPSHIFVLGIGVHPDFRRRGIGRQILARLLDDAIAEYGHDNVSMAMTVSDDNAAMLRVAESCGFERVAYIRDYFGPGKDRVYLRLLLGHQDEPAHILVPVGTLATTGFLEAQPSYTVDGTVDLRLGQCFIVREREAPSTAAR